MYPVDDLFAAYARGFEANREAEMTLPEYLEACRDNPMMYATATERLLAAIGEPEMVDTAKDARLGRIFMNRTMRVYPAVLRILRHGRDDRADRRLPAPRRAGSRGAQADHVPAWPGRRRQVIARRTAEGTDGNASHLCAEGRRPVEPGVRKPARAVQPRAHGSDAGGSLRYPAAPADRTDEPVVHQATRRIRGRHLALPRCQDAAVAAAPDRHLQDRAGRREQPGHLLACGQGRYPQAGVAFAERPGRLQLFRRVSTAPTRDCSSSSRCSRRRSRCCTRC